MKSVYCPLVTQCCSAWLRPPFGKSRQRAFMSCGRRRGFKVDADLRIQGFKSTYCHSCKHDSNLFLTLSCTVQSNKREGQLLTAVKSAAEVERRNLGRRRWRGGNREEPERLTLLFIPASVLPVAFSPFPSYTPARPTTLVYLSQILISSHCFFFFSKLIFSLVLILSQASILVLLLLILNSFMPCSFCQLKLSPDTIVFSF